MNDNFYSVKPKDLRVGQTFKIQNENSGYDFFQLTEQPVYKGYIIEMQCIETRSGLPKLVLYNTNFPRDIFVQNLDTEWRSI